MKKALIIIGVTVLVIVAIPVVAIALTFAGTAPIIDGKLLSGGERIIKDGIVSSTLIPAGYGAFVLVDCGMDKRATPIVSALRDLHAEPSAVKTILLTHGHADHTSGCAVFSSASIYGMAAESALLSGTASQRSPISHIMRAKDTGVRLTHPLRDGERFSVGSLSIEAYAVPGHTDGSAAYVVNGLVYMGDSADSSKDLKLKPAKWLFSNDSAQNRASLGRLYQLLKPEASQIHWLVFSHSAPLETLAPLAQFAKSR